jgi:replicative DNA helicase
MDDLEKRLLYGLTQNNRVALDFSLQHDQKLFLNTEARIVAKPIIDYVKAYKSIPNKRILLDIYKDEPEFCEIIEKFYESDIVYDETDYKYDLHKLKENYKKFKFDELKKINLSSEDINFELNKIQSSINEIKTVDKIQTFNKKTLKDNLENFKLQYKAKMENPELGQGILTGFSYLDYIKNGLQKSDMLIVAGETGSGKSLYMGNMAINMWLQKNTLETAAKDYTKGYNVVYFSLEMSYDDIFQRCMAAIADVPSYGLRDAKLSKAEGQAVGKACKFINNYPYRFEIVDVPRGLTVEQLELQFQQIQSEGNIDCVFIDYLQLMENADDDSDDWLALGHLSGKIHEFARVYEVPVVSAVQLNRLTPTNAKNQDFKKIGLHRIGRSSLIATHATLILQLETDNELDDFRYHIIKNRHGESNGSHNIRKNFANCKIIDLPYDNSLEKDYALNEDISADISDILEISDLPNE